MLCIKFIAFARYPPRPDTSQDGGLVGLHPFESRKLCELLILTPAVCCDFRFSRILHFIVISYIMFFPQGDAFKETEGPECVVYALYSFQGLLVIFTSFCPPVTCSYET